MSISRDFASLANQGVTAAEFDKLDGVTASTAELNVLTGGITTLGAVTAVTLGSAVVFPAGHVIKTGYTQVGTVSSYESTDQSFNTTPLYVDHVAAANDSHIYVLCQFNISFNLSTGTAFKIMKDGVDVGVGTNEQAGNTPANITFYPHGRNINYAPDSQTIQVMDKTGSIVKGTTYRYMLYIACLDNSQTIYMNRGASWGTASNTSANLSTIYTAEVAQ